MKGALRLIWTENKTTLLVSTLLALLMGWLLAAPVGPMSASLLTMIGDTPFIKKLVSAMMGMEVDGRLTVKLLLGGSWSHPFVLFLIWSLPMIACSRFPALAVENKSIDLLLSQPISRRTFLVAQTMFVILGSALAILALSIGFFVGCRNLGDSAPSFADWALVASNLFATTIFFTGLVSLLSCYHSQRMRVMGISSLGILWSLLLGYLKHFLPIAAKLSPLGLLHYYRPGRVLNTGTIPIEHLAALIIGGVVLWLIGERILNRRDL